MKATFGRNSHLVVTGILIVILLYVISILYRSPSVAFKPTNTNPNPASSSGQSSTPSSSSSSTANPLEEKQPSLEPETPPTSSLVNIPPVAKILVDKGKPDLKTGCPGIITLDGTQSYDPDGKIVLNSPWTAIRGKIANVTNYNWDNEGIIKFRTNMPIIVNFTVRDDRGAITSKNIEVNPVFPNSSSISYEGVKNMDPVVKILVDKGKPDLKTGSPGIITLDGTQSYDCWGKILQDSYSWTVVKGHAINLTSGYDGTMKFKTKTPIVVRLVVTLSSDVRYSKDIEVTPLFPPGVQPG